MQKGGACWAGSSVLAMGGHLVKKCAAGGLEGLLASEAEWSVLGVRKRSVHCLAGPARCIRRLILGFLDLVPTLACTAGIRVGRLGGVAGGGGGAARAGLQEGLAQVLLLLRVDARADRRRVRRAARARARQDAHAGAPAPGAHALPLGSLVAAGAHL